MATLPQEVLLEDRGDCGEDPPGAMQDDNRWGGKDPCTSSWQLVTGHSKGQIIIWDPHQGPIRSVAQLGCPGVAVRCGPLRVSHPPSTIKGSSGRECSRCYLERRL